MDINASTKKELYSELKDQIQSICEDESFWVTNLSNASSVIYHALQSSIFFEKKPINWCGFYIIDPKKDSQLILGPFQGKPACTVIPLGKGVCGTSASKRQTMVVRDVHEFPGHIACDSASNSEIVVPIVLKDRVLGVLDIDCTTTDGFCEEDKIGLEAIVSVIRDSCYWTL
ncbi:GAF domain-like protein [Pilobolus umbonatus]|nr:GAF domain-like protein [Pilobolus umbonatus]